MRTVVTTLSKATLAAACDRSVFAQGSRPGARSHGAGVQMSGGSPSHFLMPHRPVEPRTSAGRAVFHYAPRWCRKEARTATDAVVALPCRAPEPVAPPYLLRILGLRWTFKSSLTTRAVLN